MPVQVRAGPPPQAAARPPRHEARPPRQAAALAATLAVLAVGLAGCSTTPAPRDGADGPEARTPSGLERVPDAVPRIEPIRAGGPNKPYTVMGQSYTPLAADRPLAEEGLASWYGRKFHGRPTASGEPYDMYAMTAAHRTLPIPSYASVRNPANGREVIVRINDRGPFVAGRVIDLSYAAAIRLGVQGGVAPVQLRRITPDEIRSGSWQAAAAPAAPAAAAALSIDDPAPNDAASGAGFWLQLGAFRQRDGAAALRERALRDAEGLLPMVVLRPDEGGTGLIRVQGGPFATRADALQAAERLRGLLGATPVLVERR